MTLKTLHENRNLFSVLGNPKQRLRKAILKDGSDSEFISLVSEVC